MEPSLFRRLVLADTLGGFITPEIQAAVASSKGFEIQSTDHLGGHPALSLSFTQRFPDRAHLYQCLSAMGSVDGQVMIPRLLAHTHSKEDADSLTMAILCLVGDRDPLFPPRSIRALTDLLPDARITEITGCGHSPYFEDPQAWNFAVRSFLDRQ
jgi:2-succinyl-6-hydroxy-2,4-cyclohexadiene-1-carboxylate synthase